ncbi:MAG: ComEA family DNA-binding protein [Thermodesulfobacteriota bacterium]
MSRVPAFSRAQLGILILLGAVLFLLYAWRGNLVWTPSTPAASVANPVFVEIVGKVPRPGVYSFPTPPTLLELSQKAGGPEPPTDVKATLVSGSRVEVTPAGEYRPRGRMSGPRLISLGLPLDVNTATAKDLEALPGIGPVLARRLIEHRQTRGPFKNLEDLLAVSGVGENKLARLKPHIMISPLSARTGQ